jgi:hypothetical protein
MAREKDNYYMHIKESTVSDSGVYMAEAQSSYGTSSRSYGRLDVTEEDLGPKTLTMESESTIVTNFLSSDEQPPEFKKFTYDKFVKLGETLKFEAIITGSPKPKVSL